MCLCLMSDCPGPQSESVGKSDACEGCPNQEACATAPKGLDPSSLFFFHFFPSSLKFFIFFLFLFLFFVYVVVVVIMFVGNGYLPTLVKFCCLYTKLVYD